ncbi:hypothetical protein HMPREF3182_00861 [Megasphaera hutchinsoni]|uniref:Uncharacterized protein n=1 Tax=Megasphaera hutchinsoni TaxID=1588748 RepID=A0A134CFT7_9FIRM|nr:hypothetical protein HMPREF3182_00861 [Megasphaera hutchinsoni]
MQKLLQIINDKNTVNIGNNYDNLVHLRNWRIKVAYRGESIATEFVSKNVPPLGFGLSEAAEAQNYPPRHGRILSPQCIAAIKARRECCVNVQGGLGGCIAALVGQQFSGAIVKRFIIRLCTGTF